MKWPTFTRQTLKVHQPDVSFPRPYRVQPHQPGFRSWRWFLVYVQRMTDERFLTRDEAAERLCVSTQTLWRLERAGDFPRRRQITSGRVGYLLSELVAWMHERPAVGASAEQDGDEA